MTINGSLYAWAGGKTLIKVRTIEDTDSEYTDAIDLTTCWPYAMTTRNNILLFAYPTRTTNSRLQFGVRSWGTIEKNYPSSYGFSYVPSHGYTDLTQVQDLKIGCIRNYNDSLYISWAYKLGDVWNYGVDLVDNFSDPAPSFKWESFIWDGGAIWKQKEAMRIKVDTRALPAGVLITPKYQLDQGGWQYGPPMTQGATTGYVEINKRCREFQWGFDGTCTGTDTPYIVGMTAEVNSLFEEGTL
jgi:hypothetical protein